jgi:nucleoid DNA-binding protein
MRTAACFLDIHGSWISSVSAATHAPHLAHIVSRRAEAASQPLPMRLIQSGAPLHLHGDSLISTRVHMATAKKTSVPVATKKAAKAAAPVKSASASKPAAALKPIKTAFNKTSLAAHLAQQASLEPKAAKAFMAALEATVLASINKKGLGQFTLPGLLKITVQQVPAKKKRMGKDPFTGVERMFAAKPASTKVKARAMKKLKDAAA